MADTLLVNVKALLRITSTAFDTEIDDLILSARQDLILSGVLLSKANSDTDALIKRTIACYVKAHFGWDNPDYDKLLQSYAMLKQHLTLSQEYTIEGEL